jgi:hypothetical protein
VESAGLHQSSATFLLLVRWFPSSPQRWSRCDPRLDLDRIEDHCLTQTTARHTVMVRPSVDRRSHHSEIVRQLVGRQILAVADHNEILISPHSASLLGNHYKYYLVQLLHLSLAFDGKSDTSNLITMFYLRKKMSDTTIWLLQIWDRREYHEEVTLYQTQEGARTALDAYCRDNWEKAEPLPEGRAADVYFQAVPWEEQGYDIVPMTVQP